MKKLTAVIVVPMLIASLGFGLIGFTLGETNGYTSGYANGTHDGYAHGHAAGYSIGHLDGYSKGVTDGYSNGYAANSNSGYTSGYNQGQTDELGQILDWQGNTCTLYSNGYYQFKFWKAYDGTVKYTCLVQSG